MIITRTPFRISFFGGGTDYPAWYKENGGAVIATTINKYCYISCRYLPPFFDYKYRIRYSFREETGDIADIKHNSVRECLKFLNIEKGIEMVHTSDLPAQSGIGSSSSFTVGFLNALYALKGKMVSKRHLASDAIHIEQDIIKENVGSQDQTMAAFGGFNRIDFGGTKNFYVQPLTIGHDKVSILEHHLMLFFTGFSRNASDIAEEQIKNTHSKKRELKTMLDILEEASNILNSKSKEIRQLGKLLHESWVLKKRLSNLITTNKIDEIYRIALQAGALGGKLLGAGGGGFIIFLAPPEKQSLIKRKLKNLLYVPFRFETLGSQIILYAPQDFF